MVGREFDEAVLETAIARRPVLAALAEGPHHRRELEAELDLSKTTCHRIVRSFDEGGLLRRTDTGYGLSALGAFVEAQVDRFHANVRAGYRLEPLVTAFESTEIDFDVEGFADATVTRSRPDDPTPPMNRAWGRFQDATLETVRILDGTQLSPPLYERGVLETALEHGTTGEVIVPLSYAEHLVEAYPELHRSFSSPETDAQLRYRIYDDVPFGPTLHEEYVELRAYDEETGSLVLFVDADDSDAIAWGEAVYEYYRDRAEPAAAFDELPGWLAELHAES